VIPKYLMPALLVLIALQAVTTGVEVYDTIEPQAVGLVPGSSCTVTINDSTATKIECGTGQRAYECTVDSAETDTLYVGASNVSTSLYRRTATGGDVFGSNLKFEYGLSSSGNITLHCSSAIQ
jgi:hypothetical protein